MKLNKWSMGLLACSIAAAGSAFADQKVDAVNITRNGTAIAGSPVFVKTGDVIKFDASLTQNGAAGDPAAKTTGLGLCLEYTLAQTGNPTVANLFTAEYIGANPPVPQPLPNCTAGGSANIAGADQLVITPWTSIGGTFPQGATLPVKLYDAAFTIPGTFTGSTQLGFAASSTGNGNTFTSNASAATPIVLCASPTVTVAKTSDAAEPNVNGSFTVTLSAAVPAACGVGGNFPVTLTLGGTATQAADYNTVPAQAGTSVTVNFLANGAQVAQVVAVNVVDDSLIEGTETVTLTVAAGNGNYAGVANTASMNIADDDSGVSVAVSQNGAEGGANGTFTFTRTVTAGALVVNYTLGGTATNPADYSITPGAGATAATTTSVTFTAGSATAVVNVVVVDDVLVEGTETVQLTIGAGAGYGITGTNPAVMNIADNDTPPTVSVTAKTDAAEPATNGTFTLTRGGNPTPAVAVNVTVAGTATRGTDYYLATLACLPANAIPGNSFTIPALAATLTINLCVIDDTILEGNETVILTVGAPTVATDYTTAAPTAQTANIVDNEIGLGVAATVANTIEGGNLTFTITCSQATGTAVVSYSFSGTYTPTPAAVANANVNCATGLVVVVPTIDDAVQNGDRTVILTVTGATPPAAVDPARATATALVLDNDLPRVIPTMSTLGMMLMGLLLAGAAAFGIRREA